MTSGRPESEAQGPVRSDKVARRRSAMRDRLLAEAARLFAARGYLQVSVEELLEAAGISRATFYGFFSGKDALAAALLEPVFETGIAGLAPAPPQAPRALAERLLTVYLEMWKRHGDAMLLTAQVNSALYPLIRAQHDRFGQVTLAALERIHEAGLLRNRNPRLSYLVLAKTGIPLLRLYHEEPGFEALYRDSMRALLFRL